MSARNWLVTAGIKPFWCESEEDALNEARRLSLESDSDCENSVEIWQRFGSVTTIKTVTLTLPNDRKRELS